MPTDAALDECKNPSICVSGQRTGDPDTLRIFAFEGASACFESSATFGFQGLPSLSMTYVGDARCPCE